VRRREFIALAGGAVAAWPLAAPAQQFGKPVIGMLSSFSANVRFNAGFNQGMKELGFIDGQTYVIEYRYKMRHAAKRPGESSPEPYARVKKSRRNPVSAYFFLGRGCCCCCACCCEGAATGGVGGAVASSRVA